MMRRSIISLLAIGLAFVAISHSGRAEADVTQVTCMAKGTVSILVTTSRQSEMEAAGFSEVACNGRDAEVQNYRERICRFADAIPSTVAQSFEERHGVTARKLCTMANEISG